MDIQDMEKTIAALQPWRYNHHGGLVPIVSQSPVSAQVHDQWGRALLEHLVARICAGRDPSTLRAIDTGCMEGHYAEVLCAAGFGQVVGLDLSERHLERAEFLLKRYHGYGNITLQYGNVCDKALMASLGSFDLVFCHGLLYHLKDPLVLFDVLEGLLSPEPGASLLLHTQFKGDYLATVTNKPLAELQVKPLVRGERQDGLIYSPNDQSVFERVSFRLNPAALYQALLAYGYQGITAYDTPGPLQKSFDLNLVVTRRADDCLPERFQQNLAIEGVCFYPWRGDSVNKYPFSRQPAARLLGGIFNRLLAWSNRLRPTRPAPR